ncbi:MAG TPA: hypothetical protein VFT50_02645 [Baekduia sp.]|nr:hypothetical protein [Baekduia sp.]
MRRAPLPHLCALLAGVAASVALGCGDRSNLIPVNDAGTLKDQLAAVQDAVDAGDCAAAEAALNRADASAQQLPRSVDRRLRRRIADGLQQLHQVVPTDCQQTETTTTETTPETVPTETTPPETVTTETLPPETTTTTVPTTPTTTPTTPTTPTETTPTETTPGASPETGGTPDTGTTP